MSDAGERPAAGDRSTPHEIHVADQVGAAVRRWMRCPCCEELFEIERGPDGKMRCVPSQGGGSR